MFSNFKRKFSIWLQGCKKVDNPEGSWWCKEKYGVHSMWNFQFYVYNTGMQNETPGQIRTWCKSFRAARLVLHKQRRSSSTFAEFENSLLPEAQPRIYRVSKLELIFKLETCEISI